MNEADKTGIILHEPIIEVSLDSDVVRIGVSDTSLYPSVEELIRRYSIKIWLKSKYTC